MLQILREKEICYARSRASLLIKILSFTDLKKRHWTHIRCLSIFNLSMASNKRGRV